MQTLPLTASLLLALTAVPWLPAQSTDPQPAPRYDVVVYGGTAGGVAAAVVAARHGRDVLLVEPTPRLGGMTTCGLGATDIGNKAAIGGFAREFYRAIRAHYADDTAWVHESRDAFAGRGHEPGADAAWTFEPKVALAIVEELVAAAGVTVLRGAGLDLDGDHGPGGGVLRDGDRIRALRLRDGRIVAGRVFVDASYEGDLLAKAGVPYRVGREANDEYGETLDGVQIGNARYHQFTHRVDPYRIPGDPDSGLLRHVGAPPASPDGSADGGVQAYCFRLCTTDVASNRVPWTAPPDYDEQDYELLLRNFEAGDRRVPWHPVWMPNRKTDTNNNFAVSLDAIGMSWRWPEAGWRERERIFAEHLRYTQGLLWTLASNERVPADVREHFARLGRAADEFTATDHWPPQLYVREARRMVGDVVMSERHCRGVERVDDPVGLGSYGMDSHHVQRYATVDGAVRNEGDVQVGGFAPYGISYRSITPPRGSVGNLLVPVAVSATHIAFGSIRMEPVFMVLGHSAALAAHLALERGTAVQDVDYANLAARLAAEGQVLSWGAPPRAARIDPSAVDGICIDDLAAVRHGSWIPSTSVAGFVGDGYLHDDARGDPATWIEFPFEAPDSGVYRLQLTWPPHANRARCVRITVRSGARLERATIDQTTSPDRGATARAATVGWRTVAELPLARGARVSLTLAADGAIGYVTADAARLVPLR
ncbi:MAG: FAD-dependent oxidoreductase [Planctomycetes bacterium]|nr:FAD-dependent oxidoreductase [Planctomycetota bacterium]